MSAVYYAMQNTMSLHLNAKILERVTKEPPLVR